MKILILHNDLRVYWKRRLIFLRNFLKSKEISLYAIELFGKGSPYNFDSYDNKELWWHCLFPNNTNSELSKTEIERVLFSKLSEISPDVIIAGSIVFYSGALGLKWAKNNKRKFIMFDDAKPSNVRRNFIVQRIKDLITNQIDALWLPSNDYDYEYSLLYDKKRIRFFYGYNSIDNNLFKLNKPPKFDNNKILCVARLVPIKNFENLFKAWQLVEQENPYQELAIIGDGPLRQDLKELAGSLQLKHVSFLGIIPNDEIPEYMYEADAFILSSWSESWGLVVNEAMAAGLPVLLSDKINAAATLLKNDVNGYSFSPGNIEEMKQRILQYINLSLEDKIQMSVNSLKMIDTLSYDAMGQELLTTLRLLQQTPYKNPGLIASLVIKIWRGRYNTTGWDTI